MPMPQGSVFISVVYLLVFGGCAQSGTAVRPASNSVHLAFSDVLLSQLSDPAEDNASEGITPGGDERAQGAAEEAVPRGSLPQRALDQEILYKFLLSEIAGQRGNAQLAAQGYYDLAKSTRDPRLAKRAAEAASHAKMNALALDAALLWYDTDKGNKQAQQALANAFVSANKLQEAKPHLQQLIAKESNPVQALLQLNNLLSRHQDKNAVLTLVRDVAKSYPKAPEAHFAVAQAAVGASKFDVASAEIKEALKLKPDWEAAHLFNAQLIQQSESPAKAQEYLRGVVEQYPKAKDLRLAYARALVNGKQLPAAKAQYEKLLEELPNHADLVVTTGLISLQLNDFPSAERYLKRALDLNYKDPEAIKFYLGQTFEEQKRTGEAMKWYQSVEGGEQYVSAHTRYAFFLAKQNKLSEARQHLKQVRAEDEEQRIQLTQAEAHILREAKSFQESYDLLKKALEGKPDHLYLLYDLAMVAERLQKIDVLESSLRRVIQLKPDHAQAYNALGYTLADRNERLPEAKQYVEKALKLSPGDAFILDSLGWVHYRMGNHKEGLEYLQQAFAQRQDPEIAAHLGEVLWKNGRQADAEKIWRDSLKEHPENDVLVDTVKRFLR
ncbi:MAG: tetratricopeptide repeat protein [Betaproteobacteria bacterium]|nr:tetratricopeptide repeat protein [Betaproteobacteria bacterium]